ncbi:MAG: serine/threonine protein kinase [Sandaracinaceae bacterium]|nr:serine/threonine protein kinase [Sandaracinaceae bacterium]
MSPASNTATPLHDAPDDPLVGAVLAGSYALGEVMARGGMGVLYSAEHTRLGTPLVVKVLRKRYASHPVARTRFEREARATAKLSAAHVLRVLDLVETPDGRPAVVTERMIGEDLQQHLGRRKTLSVSLALDITRQVLRGLESAHAAGVIHRDVKPSNIFVSPGKGSPHVRVLDFGVAKLTDASGITKAGAVVGTPAYMPPEQAAGRPVDARGDVYSTGAVLYRMLGGRPPFSGDADAVLRAVLAGPAPALSKLAGHVPDAVCRIVERAMCRDPEGRFASATEMLRAIEALPPLLTTEAKALPAHTGLRRARLRAGLALLSATTLSCTVAFVTLSREVALRVPLALVFGALAGAWATRVRHAYRAHRESSAALLQWADERGRAMLYGLALWGALSLSAALHRQLPPASACVALAPLALAELRAWLRARALA